MIIKERYTGTSLGANATYLITGQSFGGFLAVTSGTLTITDSAGTTILNAFPVTLGNYYRIPLYLGVRGGTLTLAGGASGTVLV